MWYVDCFHISPSSPVRLFQRCKHEPPATAIDKLSVSRTPILTAVGEALGAVLQTGRIASTFDTRSTRLYPGMSTLLDRTVYLQLHLLTEESTSASGVTAIFMSLGTYPQSSGD